MTSFANHLVSPCSLEKAVLPSAVAKRNADSKPRFSASKSQRSTAGRTRPSSGGWINVSEREKFGVSSWKKTFASDFLNPLNGLGACKLQRRVQITFRGRRRNRGASATLAERHAKSTTVWPNQSSPSTFEENYILSGTSKIEGRISIKVLSVKGEEKIRVVIGCDLPGSWILHWGVINAQTSSREWNQPPVSMRPPGTALIKDYAVETPLLCAAFPSPPGEGLPLCHVEIDIRKCDSPDAIHFVLKDEETGRWYKHDGKDFVIRIPPTLFTQEISGAVKTANIIEDLLTSSNVKASPWSGFFDVMIHMLHLLKDTEKTNSDHLVSTDQVPKMSNAWNGNGVVLEETDHSILKKTKTQNRLKVSVQNAEGDLRVVSFDTDLKGQTILHWGLSKSDRGKWELPPDNMHPPNTTIYKEKAVQTPLQEKEDGNGSFGMLYVGGCYKGLKFVLNHAETNCWLDNEGKDFYVPLSFDRSFEDYGRFSEAKTVTKFDALDAETEDIRKGQLDDIRADLEKHAVLVVNVTEHQIIQDGLKSPVREEHKVLPRKFNEVEQKFEADAATNLLKEAETTLVSLPMTSLVTEHLSSEKGKGEIHNLEDVFEHELVLLEEEDQMKKASDLESQTEKLDSLHPTKEIENGDLKTDTSNGVIKLFLEESNVEIDHTKQGSTSSDLFQFEETLLNNAAKEGTSSQSNASSHFVGDSTSTSLSYKDASAILQNSELEITARSLDFDIPTMDKFQLTGNHLLEVDELAAEAYERFKASPPAPAEEKDHRLQVWRPKGKACSGTGSGTEVLLQGFNWESHRSGRWYDIICEQSAELASCGFTVMWLPPPTESISPEGYMPKDLYNLNSRYGSIEGLKKVVQKLHDVGIKVLGDAVLNHRCAHYQNHNGIWNIFGGRLNWDDRAIVSDDPHFQGRGNRSSGDNFHAAPNIDHSQEFVRRDLTEWLRWLRNEVGYDGWRLDYVRGFWGGYVKDYIEGSQPYFAVGEYWDSLSYAYGKIDYNQDAHRQRIVDWINATGGNAGAFDVTTKGILHAAFEKCEYWRLADTKRKPPGVVGWWPSRAVTFIENHDTGSTQGHWRFPAGKEMQGYAYILTHPGTPTVFYDHMFSHHREEIRSLVALRKRAGIHCRSLINIEKAEKDVYAAKIDDQVLMKIGPGHYQPPSAGKKWILTTEGRDYKVWEAL